MPKPNTMQEQIDAIRATITAIDRLRELKKQGGLQMPLTVTSIEFYNRLKSNLRSLEHKQAAAKPEVVAPKAKTKKPAE